MRKKVKLLIIIALLIIFLPIGGNFATQVIGADHYNHTMIVLHDDEKSVKAVKRVEGYLRQTYGSELTVWDDTALSSSPTRVFKFPYRNEAISKITSRAISRLLNEDPSQAVGKGSDSDEEKQSSLGWVIIGSLLVLYVIVSRKLDDDMYAILVSWYRTVCKLGASMRSRLSVKRNVADYESI